MDVATLQREISRLPDDLQDRLAAFLTALRLHRDGMDSEIQARPDDKTPENWQSWSAVTAEMGIQNPGPG